MEHFWTINLTRVEYDWIMKHLAKELPNDCNDQPQHRYLRHWHKQLNRTECIDVSIITDAKTKARLEIIFSSDEEPVALVSTISLDEPINLEIDGETYVINLKKPESDSIRVVQRPTSIEYTCPTCGYEGYFLYDEFCDMHDEPPDWREFECQQCGQVIEIDGQEWE